MEKRLLILSLAAAGLIVSGTSQASVAKPMEVIASVASACTLDVAQVDFGPYSGAPLDALGTIAVNCNVGVQYRIGITAGANPDGAKNRRMTDSTGTHFLPYRLAYMDTDWGDTTITNTTSKDFPPVTGIGKGSVESFSVEGHVWSPTIAPAPGVYRDTVMVTVAF